VLADAIVAVHQAGTQLLDRTRAWFAANASRLTIDASLVELEAVYADAVERQPASLNGHRLRPPRFARRIAARAERGTAAVAVDRVGALGADDGNPS